MDLPSSLSRNAIKMHFDKISEGRWDYYFRHEAKNGLHKLRTDDAAFDRAYYSTEGLKKWLIREAVYKTSDFEPQPSWLTIRKHALAA